MFIFSTFFGAFWVHLRDLLFHDDLVVSAIYNKYGIKCVVNDQLRLIGVGEMVQWSGALATFAGDVGLVPTLT